MQLPSTSAMIKDWKSIKTLLAITRSNTNTTTNNLYTYSEGKELQHFTGSQHFEVQLFTKITN